MTAKRARPVRDGMIPLVDRVFDLPWKNYPRFRIVPSLRDGIGWGLFPGNKLPGYDHAVPPGQRPRKRGSARGSLHLYINDVQTFRSVIPGAPCCESI